MTRLPSHERDTWVAQALRDGDDLADAFLRLRTAIQRLSADLQEAHRKTTPDAPTLPLHDLKIRKPLHEMTERFIHALVDLVVEAMRGYPKHLRHHLVPHLVGAFIARLIAQDCEHFSGNGGASAAANHPRRRE